MTQTTGSKTIAKNSLFLYLRMLVMMVVTLYTSRVVLEMLGITDFGIYNVVAGVVSFMSFFTSSMSNAAQRYLSFGIATNDEVATSKYFNQSMWLYVAFAAVIIVAAETVGLWFVKHKLVIPPDRMSAAIWAYQAALLTALISIIQIPYLADVIAREKMSMFAYMGLFEAFSKLACAYLLVTAGGADRLILYSFLLAACTLANTLWYAVFCRRFPESKIRLVWDWKLVKEMGRFIGSTIFGCFAWMVGSQGANIVLNMFFGPVVNAARGVAMQVNATLMRFTDGVYTAVRPQITKSYAAGDHPYMHKLIHKGSLYSCLLFCMISAPLVFCANTVLSLWLKEVPEYSAVFLQLVLLDTFFFTLQVPLGIGANSTGNLKRTQIYGRLIILFTLPLCYGIFKFGAGLDPSPTVAFWILAAASALYWLYSLYDMHKQLGMEYSVYWQAVLKPLLIVLLPLLAGCWLSSVAVSQKIVALLLTCTVSVLITGALTYRFVMGPTERQMAAGFVNKFLRKK